MACMYQPIFYCCEEIVVHNALAALSWATKVHPVGMQQCGCHKALFKFADINWRDLNFFMIPQNTFFPRLWCLWWRKIALDFFIANVWKNMKSKNKQPWPYWLSYTVYSCIITLLSLQYNTSIHKAAQKSKLFNFAKWLLGLPSSYLWYH